MRAIDVSNYTGDLSESQLTALKVEGIEMVVVRLSLETPDKRELAMRQLQACATSGLRISGYVWCYWHQDPGSVVIDALALVKEAKVPIEMLWIDAEEAIPPGKTGVDLNKWLRSAITTATLGGQAVGIYTARWFWLTRMPVDIANFADIPLWTAQYDGIADLDVWERYGGWTELAGKQYQGDTTVAGIPSVDLNVFDSIR